jgi:hypothetical protein
VLFLRPAYGIKHWGPQPQDLRFTGHAALYRNTVITDDCKPSSITALDLRSSRPQMRPHRPAHVTASIKCLSGGGRGYPGRAPARRNLFGVPSPPSKRGPLSDVQDNCSTLTCAASQRCRSSCPTFQCQPVRLHCNLISWFNLRARLATHCLLELHQWSEYCGRGLVRGAFAIIASFLIRLPSEEVGSGTPSTVGQGRLVDFPIRGIRHTSNAKQRNTFLV